MKSICTILMEEQEQLEKILAEAKKRNENAPAGNLYIKRKHGKMEYYLEVDGKRRYIKKCERGVAEKIAQRDYDTKVIKRVERRLREIHDFLKVYETTCLKRLYRETNPYRRELVQATVLSDEEYVKRWLDVEYEGKEFEDNENEIITERGERVRSKSEKIIADKLYLMGIPYRYEYPLILRGNIRIYPDFTILKVDTKEEVYLEHFGMMDDVDYIAKALFKIHTYEKNHIFLGRKLFITYETYKNPLNTRVLNQLLRELFL